VRAIDGSAVSGDRLLEVNAGGDRCTRPVAGNADYSRTPGGLSAAVMCALSAWADVAGAARSGG